MNEIFKGMDNAAEQINENFEELDYQVIDWTEISLEDSFENFPNEHGGLHFKKFGDVVMLAGTITNKDIISTISSVEIGTLPEIVAPTHRVTTIQPGSDKIYYNLEVNKDGKIKIGRYNNGTGASGRSDIPKGAWLNIYTTYII